MRLECYYFIIIESNSFLNESRHLHGIFNESIICMSHFSIGMIDIHNKNKFKIFFSNSKWPLSLESKSRK